MSRIVTVALVLSLLAGCGRERPVDPKVVATIVGKDVVVVALPPQEVVPKGNVPKASGPTIEIAPEPIPVFAAPDPANDQYDAALAQALTLLADQDFPKALEAFEAAKSAKDTDFVRGEIEKLRARVDSDIAAKKTIVEIQTVLDDGNPAVAGKLVAQALQEFGGGPDAAKLLQLQAQANALLAAQGNEEPKVRFQNLRDQGQAALRDQNLRAAAAAFAQALLLNDDAGVRIQLKDVQSRLDKYDDLRRRAADLRRDPNHAEDALALLRDAAQAWNTPEVRNDIDDCTIALQKRRDTLGIAEFETIGDLGVPGAGQVIAEELLPTFKARFDLVDRAQVAKALQDLNLGAAFQNNPDLQLEVGKLARAKFLVLGSVRRVGAVTAHARLVDASTGLIVQTAKISAPTFEQLLPLLPELTKQLLMSDDEKLAFDAQQFQVVQRIEPIPENAPLPPPPPANPPAPAAAPPAPWFDAAPPPGFGALQIAQLQAIPAPPAVVPQIVIVDPPTVIFRSRLVNAVVMQGDGFFARGMFREAFHQYEFALSLAPNDFDIRARLDRCRPVLPPVFVQPIVLRPRLAIMNFLVVGNPAIVPPGLSVMTPNLLAPYFRCNYDLVDSGEVYWMMAQLGMTQYDLMNDPNSRRWLGRALNVQFFLMGAVEQSASFDVSTYLLNAEHGWMQGTARMHVHNPFELKMRAGELAQITQLPPGQRVAFVNAQPQVNLLIAQGQTNLQRGNFQIALTLFQNALFIHPGNVQALVYLNQTQTAHRQWEFEETRRRELAERQAFALAAQRRQLELAQAAEAARIQAAQLAGARAEGERRAIAQQRADAYADMVARARTAHTAKNYVVATNLFQGALDLAPIPGPGAPAPLVALPVPHDTLVRELAEARAEVARANEQRFQAEKIAGAETIARQQREKDLLAVKQKIAADAFRAKISAQLHQGEIDANYQAAFNQGQTLMTQGKFDAAIVALQGARQWKKTEAVEAMLHTAIARQAEAAAQAQAGEAGRKLVAEKLAEDQKRKNAAEAEAKRNHDQYDAAMKAAQTAFAEKKLDAAQTHFQTAGKLFNNDAVLGGLKQVQAARAADSSAAQAAKDQAAKAQRTTELLSAGKAALDAGKFAESVRTLEQARKLDPSNVDVLAALSRAEQARDRAQIGLNKKTIDINQAAKDAKEKVAKGAQEELLKKDAAVNAAMIAQANELRYQQLVAQGQALIGQKKYTEAVTALEDALKIKRGEPAAGYLAQALAGAAEVQALQLAEQKKKTSYADALKTGQQLLGQKKFPEALQAFQSAKTLYPTDPQANQLFAQTTQAWEAAKKFDVPAKKDPPKVDVPPPVKKDSPKIETPPPAKKEPPQVDVPPPVKKDPPIVVPPPVKVDLPPVKKDPPKIETPPPAKKDPPKVDVPPPVKKDPPIVVPPPVKVDLPPVKKDPDRVQYQGHMTRGEQLLAQRQFAAAAQQFEAALQLIPGDANATRLLQQAKTQKK